jgi:hypothetical protein
MPPTTGERGKQEDDAHFPRKEFAGILLGKTSPRFIVAVRLSAKNPFSQGCGLID